MLIDVRQIWNLPYCQVMQVVDEDFSELGFPFMQYYTEADYDSVVEWLYPGGQLDFSATILCSTNESVDMWNAVAKGMNPSEEHIMWLKDCFSEVDDMKGHLKNRMSTTMLNGFKKYGVPNHELILKFGDICLVTCAFNGLGLAFN